MNKFTILFLTLFLALPMAMKADSAKEKKDDTRYLVGAVPEVDGKVVLEDNRKIIGIIITTDYEYDLDPEITIKFKNSESGASGGLMLTLTIYNAI